MKTNCRGVKTSNNQLYVQNKGDNTHKVTSNDMILIFSNCFFGNNNLKNLSQHQCSFFPLQPNINIFPTSPPNVNLVPMLFVPTFAQYFFLTFVQYKLSSCFHTISFSPTSAQCQQLFSGLSLLYLT